MQEVLDDGADASPEHDEEVIEAEAEVAESDGVEESEADSPPAGDENAEEKTSSGLQGRIDKLTKRFYDSEREKEELREKLAEAQKKPVQIEPIKTLAEFNYDEAAFFAYSDERARNIAREEARNVAVENSSKIEEKRQAREFESRERAYAKTVKDYDEVTAAEKWACSKSMAEEIRASEIGPDMTYYLAKNADIALEIAQLPDREAIKRMTLLELELQSKKEAIKRKVSNAPPPPEKSIGSGNAVRKVSTTSPESDRLSDDEWFLREEARVAKLRR